LRLGGSTTFLCNLAGELVRRQVPVRVDSFEAAHPLADDFDAQNVPVTKLDERSLIFEDRLTAVLDRLREFQPTAIVATLGTTAFEVLRYAPGGVYRIGMVQSDSHEIYAQVRRYSAWTDAMVGVSEKVADQLRQLPEFARLPVHYIPYGVPLPPVLAPNIRSQLTPLRILYLGRLDQEQKRVRLLPLIQQRLIELGVPAVWTIAGDGPERSFLASTMRTGCLGQQVTLTGVIPYRSISSVMAGQDIYLLTSDYEGLPLSLLEAMGQGLVPVVSDLPSGIREVVNESTGYRIPPQTCLGYALAIQSLHNDRAKLQLLRENARQRVLKDFSIRAMTDRWVALASQAKQGIHWPANAQVLPIVSTRNPWKYREPLRTLRRWNKQLLRRRQLKRIH
jgi:glycosyltransferase involved in cell wall biosynthesis